MVVSADDDSMSVIITVDKNTYKAGDSGEVSVHVFDKGEYADPDQTPVLSVNSGSYYWDDDDMDTAREIKTEKKSKGLYEGDFEIYDSDAEGGSYMSLSLVNSEETAGYRYYQDNYALSIGREDDEDQTYNYISSYDAVQPSLSVLSEEGFKVDLKIIDYENYPFQPGDKITMQVTVTDNGKKLKPDDFVLVSRLSDYDYYDYYVRSTRQYYDDDYYYYGDEVPYNIESDGIYLADYTVPSSLDSDARVYISAYAQYGTKQAEDSLSFEINFFEVWMHSTDSTSSQTRDFDIYVGDTEGKAVDGASVTIRYLIKTEYEPDWWDEYYYYYSYATKTEKSDVSGKTSFELTDITSDMDINGWVVYDDFNQSFSGTIEYDGETDEEDDYYYGYGFEVECLEDKVDLSSGSKVRFKATNGSEVFKGETIYYYVYSEYEVLISGNVKTDTKGKFSLDIPKPTKNSEEVAVLFEAATMDHPEPMKTYDWEDSDWDGYSDNFEKQVGTDPDDRYDYPNENLDSDGDGFTDKFETHIGSNPEDDSDYPNTYRDYDGDSFGDQYEEDMGTDPKDDYDYPSDYEDSDNDDFGDEFEIDQGTNPNDYYDHPSEDNDTDYDGHTDEEEIFYGTDPNDYSDYPRNTYQDNSDGDYTYTYNYYYYYDYDYHYDDEEVFYGTDPNDDSDYPTNEYQDDDDYDGYCNAEEEFFGTDPDDYSDYPQDRYDKDSDGDGVCDLEEVFYGSDPEDYTDNPSDTYGYYYYDYSDHVSNNGKYYEEDTIYLPVRTSLDDYVSDDVHLSINNFQVGKATGVDITVPDNSNENFVASAWFMGDIDDADLYSDPGETGEWQHWGGYGSDILLLPQGSTGMGGKVIVPEFLPKGDQEYTFVALYYDYTDYEIKVNYLTLKDGQSGTTQEEDENFLDKEVALGLTVFHFGIIVVIILILALGLIVVVLVLKIKKTGKKKDKPKTPPQQRPPGHQQRGQADAYPAPPPPRMGHGHQQQTRQREYPRREQQHYQGHGQQQQQYYQGQQGHPQQGQQQQQYYQGQQGYYQHGQR
jgi:hypothetical protein